MTLTPRATMNTTAKSFTTNNTDISWDVIFTPEQFTIAIMTTEGKLQYLKPMTQTPHGNNNDD